MVYASNKPYISYKTAPKANGIQEVSGLILLISAKNPGSYWFPGFFLTSATIRTALVTARNAPAHARAIKTQRKWDVHIDEAFFLGGVSKTEVLSAFGAHIFFDDQYRHAEPASEVVPSAVVPYRDGEDPSK